MNPLSQLILVIQSQLVNQYMVQRKCDWNMLIWDEQPGQACWSMIDIVSWEITYPRSGNAQMCD
jgi:hypothetical protein